MTENAYTLSRSLRDVTVSTVEDCAVKRCHSSHLVAVGKDGDQVANSVWERRTHGKRSKEETIQ